MAQEITLATQQLITNASVSGNGTYDIFVSADQNNAQIQHKGLRLVIRYDDITPDFGNTELTFELTAFVETKIGSIYTLAAYQFEPYRNSLGAEEHIIVMQPDLVVIDQGIPDVAYAGDEPKTLTHRQNVKLGDTWRVRVALTERGHGGPGAFQSVKLSVFGESYDVP